MSGLGKKRICRSGADLVQRGFARWQSGADRAYESGGEAGFFQTVNPIGI